MRADLGIVGLGTMGSNLALNAEDHGVAVALLDLDDARVRSFIDAHAERDLVGASDPAEFVGALARPRRILLSVPAGDPVDAVLADLVPRLDAGDVVVDGGNSHFTETERRQAELAESGVRLLGMGVSGGAEGARHGPSLMPGGPRDAYDALEDVLVAIAAESDRGPCVAWLGPGGAGHFVKMVHNGIEYADMQAIAEAYDTLARGLGLGADELAATFEAWNAGPLESFLVEITAAIFRVKDDDGRPLVERVLDAAEQKGTGRWTAIAAFEHGVPAPSIAAAVDARVLSSRKAERERASGVLGDLSAARPVEVGDPHAVRRDVESALYASRISAFAQGMDLVRGVSDARGWDVPRDEVARVWRAGCIIRAALLDPIGDALAADPALDHLILADPISERLAPHVAGWRRAICFARRLGIPVPCWSAGLDYVDAFRTARLPQNLTQAQRDWFGAHRYRTLDDPTADPVHTDWAAAAAEAGPA